MPVWAVRMAEGSEAPDSEFKNTSTSTICCEFAGTEITLLSDRPVSSKDGKVAKRQA